MLFIGKLSFIILSLLSKCNQKCLEKWSFIFITWSFSARRLAPPCGQWQHKTPLFYWMLLTSGPFSAHRWGELYHSGIHSGSAASTLWTLISGSAKGQQKFSVSQTLLGKPKRARATVPKHLPPGPNSFVLFLSKAEQNHNLKLRILNWPLKFRFLILKVLLLVVSDVSWC